MAFHARAPRSKYGVRTDALGKLLRTVDGILFDSLAEVRRYRELCALLRAGAIDSIELQPRFPLVVASTSGLASQAASALAGTFDGRVGHYVADFRYEDERGRTVIEDVKGGPTTAVYRLKRKMVEKQYGIQITEVRYR